MEFEFVEHREEDRSGLSRHRERRRHPGDPAHPGLEPGDAADVPRGERVLVDIAEAVLVRNEVKASSVGCILRVDVLDLAEHAERRYPARGHVQECDLWLAVQERLEVRNRSPVGDEGDGGSVRRPGRLKVGVFIVGQLDQRPREDIPGIEVADASSEPRKGDELAIGGPCRTGNRPNALEGYFPRDVAALYVHDRQLVVSVGEHREHELGAVRRPVSRRVDEP